MSDSSKNPDALPQLIGEFRPVDEWQAHMARIFYGLRAGRLHEFYQTFATADYRLAHALAADYYERVRARDKAARGREAPADSRRQASAGKSLTVMEWGCGNGNLAACFLTHLKHLDKDGAVYPRVRYVLVDNQEAILKTALAHADLTPHRAQVDILQADVAEMGAVKGSTVDRILCNELWNELPTKLMLRKKGEIEEEYIRPNLSEKKHAEIADWSGFIKAFETMDIGMLERFPAFLEDIVWEREYRKAEWKSVPYRKTITDFLKQIDEEVLIPVNLGAFATVKEATRVLAPDAVGFSSFDAGTAEMMVLNDPEKPCYGQFGGQYSFMVNFALMDAVAKHQGVQVVEIEPQKEFVGRSLGANVLSLMDLLSSYPEAGSLRPWKQAKLVVETLHALNERHESPYTRKIEFPFPEEMPLEERETLQNLVRTLKQTGMPDTIAYLTEEELWRSMGSLEKIGYRRDVIQTALLAPPQGVDYCHFSF
jgi:hypothetical protein